jgi:hypothetical protein
MTKTEPRSDSMRRAWMQVEQRPAWPSWLMASLAGVILLQHNAKCEAALVLCALVEFSIGFGQLVTVSGDPDVQGWEQKNTDEQRTD